MLHGDATNGSSRSRLLLAGMVACGLYAWAPGSAFAQWPQWGGPDRNFVVDTMGLADKWPEGGPKKLWSRPIGTGYSGIAVDNGVLYTMYRTEGNDKFEYTIAIDAKTGKTLWEHKQLAAVPDSVKDYGKKFSGPNSTPLVVGDRVYTAGRNATLLCLNKKDGAILWERSLVREFGAETHTCGFSTSPIAYGKTIILSIGQVDEEAHKGHSLVALDQETGDVAWTNQTFKSWHSSPILITYGGKRQLVQCTNSALIGVNPDDGSLLWKYEYPNADQYESIWVSPVWDGKDTIFFASRKVGCAVRLTRQGSKTVVKPLWSDKKYPLGMGTPVVLGDLLVGAKRGENAAFLGLDIHTGKRFWHKRLFAGATLVGDAEKLIVLDKDGELSLVKANKESLTVASTFQVTEQYSFTAPALAGTTLYVRDEKNIMAFDLSVEGSDKAD